MDYYNEYDKYVFTLHDLSVYKKQFYEEIEMQKKEILKFEKRAKERIILVDSWERQKNFVILGSTYKDGRKKCIMLIKRYPDQSQRDERYEFDKIADMRKQMAYLEEEYSGADWSRFKKEIE